MRSRHGGPPTLFSEPRNLFECSGILQRGGVAEFFADVGGADKTAHDLCVARFRNVGYEQDIARCECLAELGRDFLFQLGCQARSERSRRIDFFIRALFQNAKTNKRFTFDWIGHADRGRFANLRVGYENRFHFRGADPFPSNFDRVVAAPENVPKPVIIDRGPVAVYPCLWPARPVTLEVTLPILPKSAGHADPRFSNNQLADFAT